MVLFAPFKHWLVCTNLWLSEIQSYSLGLTAVSGKAIIYDKFIPESCCGVFSHLSGSDNSLLISHKVVGYDQDIHIDTGMGIFYCQKVHMD